MKVLEFLWKKINEHPGKFQALVVGVLANLSSWGVNLNGEQVAGAITLTGLAIAFLITDTPVQKKEE